MCKFISELGTSPESCSGDAVSHDDTGSKQLGVDQRGRRVLLVNRNHFTIASLPRVIRENEEKSKGASMTSTYDVMKAWRERHITGNEALEMSGLPSIADLSQLASACGLGTSMVKNPDRRRRDVRPDPAERPQARSYRSGIA